MYSTKKYCVCINILTAVELYYCLKTHWDLAYLILPWKASTALSKQTSLLDGLEEVNIDVGASVIDLPLSCWKKTLPLELGRENTQGEKCCWILCCLWTTSDIVPNGNTAWLLGHLVLLVDMIEQTVEESQQKHGAVRPTGGMNVLNQVNWTMAYLFIQRFWLMYDE